MIKMPKPVEVVPSIDMLCLADFTPTLTRLKNDLRKGKKADTKIRCIDLAITELTCLLNVCRWQFRQLADREPLDFPELFWDYKTNIEFYISQLSIQRERITLDEILHDEKPKTPKCTTPETQPPKPTASPANPEAPQSSPAPEQPVKTTIPDLMTLEHLALSLDKSLSWVYKHYRDLTIPYTMVGNSPRFLKLRYY